MLVLTSNSAESINKAMIRPGRIDVVIHIDAPDAALSWTQEHDDAPLHAPLALAEVE